MLRHIALLRLKDGAAPERKDQIAAALRELGTEIDTVMAIDVRLDAGLGRGNHDLVMVADFDDEAAFRAYLGHPVHQRAIRELLLPYVADTAFVQHDI